MEEREKRILIFIRRAKPGDAAGIIEVHRRSIREICSKDYSPEQVAAWAGRDFSVERWQKTIEKHFVWVLSDHDHRIFGFGHLMLAPPSSAVLAGLYFAPEALGNGYGRAMVGMMFEACRERGVREVTLKSTLTAKGFYEAMGFTVSGSLEKIVMLDQALDCWPMIRQMEGGPMPPSN